MPIEPQEVGETLEDRISGEVSDEVLEAIPEPQEVPVGPADYKSPTHVAPQV